MPSLHADSGAVREPFWRMTFLRLLLISKIDAKKAVLNLDNSALSSPHVGASPIGRECPAGRLRPLAPTRTG